VRITVLFNLLQIMLAVMSTVASLNSVKSFVLQISPAFSYHLLTLLVL